MNDSTHPPIRYVAAERDCGLPLKTILRDRMKLSRKLLSRLKQTEHGIALNGKRAYTNVQVQPGDLVEVRLPAERSDDILPEPIPLDIIYEDDYLLVVNKAAGLIVHPTHGHYTGTLANAVVHYWQTRGRQFRFRPIHRLDQHTSGALAIAKNAFIHQQVSEQMKKNQVDKSYIAFVHGQPDPSSGTIEGAIGRSDHNPHIRIVRPDGYPSVTHYETLETYGEAASLVALRLETGRTHQIRVHMQHIGSPLIGDPMYGHAGEDGENPALDRAIDRQALHARSLSFRHPMTGERLEFIAPWPEDLLRLRNYLRDQDVERSSESK